MRTRDRAAAAVVGLGLAATALLLGGAPRWAACLSSALLVVGALVYATSRRRETGLAPLVALLAVIAAVTAAALVPLPEMIADQVARPRLELVHDHAAAFEEARPTWTVASYDPPATLVELAKLAGYVALAWLASRLAAERAARAWLATAVVGAPLLVGLVIAGHAALGADRLYGWFVSPVPGQLPSPIINANHLAALAALACPLALGLGVHARGRPRLAALAAMLTLIAMAVGTGSRSGAVGLVAGLLATMTALVLLRRSQEPERRHPRLMTAMALIAVSCAVVLLVVFTGGTLSQEVQATQLAELGRERSKFQVWGLSLQLVQENPWLGIGRGAFETTFPRVGVVGDTTYSHAESSFLQLVIEWGIPGALLVTALALAIARRAVRRGRHGPLEAGALGAVVSILVHDLADFSLELPVVAMAVIVASSLLLPVRLRASAASGPEVRRSMIVRATLVVAGLAVIATAASSCGRSAREDRDRIAAATGDRFALARAALRRHPADGLVAGHAAQALFAQRSPRTAHVASRALYLQPNHPGLHHLAARVLAASQRPRQAQVEFALALRWARRIDPILDDLLRVFPTAEDAARCLPLELRHVSRLRSALAQRERGDVTLAYLRRMVALFPTDLGAQLALAQQAIALGRPEEALGPAALVHDQRPSAASALALAQARAATGHPAEAIELLRRAPPAENAGQTRLLAGVLSQLLHAQGDLLGARAVLLEAAARLQGHPGEEADLQRWLANVEAALRRQPAPPPGP
ncbi:MAG: O-antigen ligase family protein [Kofleriaceae bacterium]|nr:O-antigen ligase family protein [Kofleriaceae bacterium]MCL4224152.1 O-antigen ligase family protein [Myxococcales bacterium]